MSEYESFQEMREKAALTPNELTRLNFLRSKPKKSLTRREKMALQRLTRKSRASNRSKKTR